MKSKREQTSPERIAELRAMPYLDYLKTQEWIRRRIVKLQIAEYRCQLCNSSESLQVHHRTYERLGCEKMGDLLVLCRACHAHFHERLRLAKKEAS